MTSPNIFAETLTFDPASLSVEDMFDLRAGLGTVFDVLSGLICQPRFSEDDGDEQVLSSLWEMIAAMRQAITDEALERSPATEADTELLIAFAADQWIDGSVKPDAALKGVTEALARLVEKGTEGSA